MSTNYRDAGDQHLASATKANEEATAEDGINAAHYTLTAATNHLLLAVYSEIRHGHDQQAKALDNLTAAIESLTNRLGGTQ